MINSSEIDCHPVHFRADTHDFEIFKAACSEKEYGHLDVRGKVVVDVGAHIGGFTHYCAAQGAKSVHSFEANPDNFRYLKMNCDHYSNVSLNQSAVWYNSTDKLSSKQLNELNTGGAYLSIANQKNVELTVLFQYLEQRKIDKIDILKLDCEGSEYPILYSMSSTELSKIYLIIGEYHNGYGTDLFSYDDTKQPLGSSLINYLAENGFNCHIKREIDKDLGIFQARYIKKPWWNRIFDSYGL